jgi:uncharacterized protein (DUF433 family)/DNA-binding transcriptional MerR regulator
LERALPDGMNLLLTGIYTISEAAALIGVSKRRVRGWVIGYEDTKRSPLIDNELGSFGRVNGRIAFSFANLMEMQFIKFFEDAGLKPAYIRSIFDEARRMLRTPHPFATRNVFLTDGRKIMEEGVSSGGLFLYDLKTKNYEMKTVVIDTLMDDVVYDASGHARLWYPRRYLAPNVIIHPRFAFGQPVLRDSAIPTRTIANAVKAEGNQRAVATWYDLPEKQVREAVRFEDSLRKAA